MKRVCLFGIYDINYARNRVIKKGLIDNGFDVIECRVDPKESKGIVKYLKLFRGYRDIKDKNFDHIFVLFPGHSVVWLAYILFGNRLIFDVFVSLFDSNVNDRKLYKSFSIRGIRDFIYDFYSTNLARHILIDTNSHTDYFVKKFKVNRGKFIRLFVGSDDSILVGIKGKTNNDFVVHFHGNFIPLQGIENIIKAISIVKNKGYLGQIKFRIIGNGQEYKKIIKLASNLNVFEDIEFLDRLPFYDLMQLVGQADILLGIFGGADKANRVIPNKVYEGVILNKVIISMNSDAIRELFEDRVNIYLVDKDKTGDLADAIIRLYLDKELFNKIKIGVSSVRERILPKILISDMIAELNYRK